MKTNNTLAALMIASAVLMTGCANTQQSQPYSASTPDSATYGTIDSIQALQGNPGSSNGLGAVAGGVVGALLGNQVGSGGGRTAATLAGAVGGAVVGNEVEKNRNQGASYQINVRLDNGQLRRVVQDSAYDLNAGNRVRVIDNRVYRY